MTLEIVVTILAALGYLLGSLADERRARRQQLPGLDGQYQRRLQRLRDGDTVRPRLPLTSSP